MELFDFEAVVFNIFNYSGNKLITNTNQTNDLYIYEFLEQTVEGQTIARL